MSKKIKRTIILVAAASFIGLGVFCYFHSIHMPAWMTYPYDITILKGNVRINKYLGKEEKIEIPSRIFGAKVVEVDYKAFNDIGTRAVIEDVSEDIVYVGRVFDYKSQCYYGLSDDSAWVSEYTGNEKKVEIPETIWGREIVGINLYAFYKCDIEEVLLPETVKYIEAYAFKECKNIKRIVLPTNLEYIGVYAFSKSGIEEIEFPNTVDEISGYAFHCSALKEVSGLENVKNLGNDPFRGTPWEESFEGDFFCIGEKLYLYRGEDEEVVVPETVKEIKGAFAKSDEYSYPIKVKKVFIPDSVTAISECSFWNQNNVEVYIPETVVSLGMGTEAAGSAYSKSIFHWEVGNGTIVTTAGSPAEAYAKEEKIPCRIITKEEMQQEMEAAKKRQENR